MPFAIVNLGALVPEAAIVRHVRDCCTHARKPLRGTRGQPVRARAIAHLEAVDRGERRAQRRRFRLRSRCRQRRAFCHGLRYRGIQPDFVHAGRNLHQHTVVGLRQHDLEARAGGVLCRANGSRRSHGGNRRFRGRHRPILHDRQPFRNRHCRLWLHRQLADLRRSNGGRLRNRPRSDRPHGGASGCRGTRRRERRRHADDRFLRGVLTRLDQLAQVLARTRVARIERESALQRRRSFLKASRLHLRESQVVQQMRRIGHACERRPERLDRQLVASLLPVGDAQAVERFAVFRLEDQRIAKAQDRGIGATFGQVQAADRILPGRRAGGLLHAVQRLDPRVACVQFDRARRARTTGDQRDRAGGQRSRQAPVLHIAPLCVARGRAAATQPPPPIVGSRIR